MERSWLNLEGASIRHQVMGCFDPIRHVMGIVQRGSFEDPIFLGTLSHEYNHLIGIAGRHLQVTLMDSYFGDRRRCHDIVKSERAIVESLVPVWMTYLSGSASRGSEFPQSDPQLVDRIDKACRNLVACHWIIDGVHTAIEFGSVLLALQQAVLNVSEPDTSYSAGASRTALRFLEEAAGQLRGQAIHLRLIPRGEWQTLESAVREPNGLRGTVPDRGGMRTGSMIELFLVGMIQRGTDLEIKRYTTHERCGLVLKWISSAMASGMRSDSFVEVLGTLASVYVPWAFIPVITLYYISDTRCRASLVVLPIGPASRTAAMVSSVVSGRRGSEPAGWSQPDMLTGILEALRQTSACQVVRSMSECYKVGMSNLYEKPFNAAADVFFKRVSSALEEVLHSMENAPCAGCRELRRSLTEDAWSLLRREARDFLDGAASRYVGFVGEHVAAELARDALASDLELT